MTQFNLKLTSQGRGTKSRSFRPSSKSSQARGEGPSPGLLGPVLQASSQARGEGPSPGLLGPVIQTSWTVIKPSGVFKTSPTKDLSPTPVSNYYEVLANLAEEPGSKHSLIKASAVRSKLCEILQGIPKPKAGLSFLQQSVLPKSPVASKTTKTKLHQDPVVRRDG